MFNLMLSTTVAMVLPMIVYMLAWILSMRQTQSTREKMSPYECGFDPNHNARVPFSLRFFLLAIIFVVFDIEIVLLIPLPLLTNSFITATMISSLVFLIILLLGLFHEWNQGSLNWSN